MTSAAALPILAGREDAKRMKTKALGALRPWRQRQRIAVLAFCALLFHALSPVLHLPARSAADTSLLRDLMLLCAAPEPAVEADAMAPASDPAAPKSKVPYCPACLGFQAVAACLPSAQTELAQPRAGPVAHVFDVSDPWIAQRSHAPQSARAPPAHA
jgi:hypothetical protein